MKINSKASLLLASGVLASVLAAPETGNAAGSAPHIERQQWSFSGITGTYDKAQLQRGFQVYQNVCSACHGLERLSWRNLVEEGGSEFPEEAVKALAAEWPNQITDGPNDEGEMFERPALLSDPIRSPTRTRRPRVPRRTGPIPPICR